MGLRGAVRLFFHRKFFRIVSISESWTSNREHFVNSSYSRIAPRLSPRGRDNMSFLFYFMPLCTLPKVLYNKWILFLIALNTTNPESTNKVHHFCPMILGLSPYLKKIVVYNNTFLVSIPRLKYHLALLTNHYNVIDLI